MEIEVLNKLIENPELLNKDTVHELKCLVEEYPAFQLAWWLYLKNLKQIKSPDFDNILKTAAIRVSDRTLLFKFLNTNFQNKHFMNDIQKPTTNVYTLEGEGEVITGDSLIDKFLTSEPGLIRQKGNLDEGNSIPYVKEIVANSVEENDEIITETLAILYFEQKNYDKALDAYHKLSLKYPEKSVYFATRIEEIEKLKNI